MYPQKLDRDPIDARAVTRAFHAALDRARLPAIRFHDLGHTTATFLLAQGFGLQDVKHLPGHSSIGLTSNTYGHVLEEGSGRWGGGWTRCWAASRVAQ